MIPSPKIVLCCKFPPENSDAYAANRPAALLSSWFLAISWKLFWSTPGIGT